MELFFNFPDCPIFQEQPGFVYNIYMKKKNTSQRY